VPTAVSTPVATTRSIVRPGSHRNLESRPERER
jgi:hypothetical protein